MISILSQAYQTGIGKGIHCIYHITIYEIHKFLTFSLVKITHSLSITLYNRGQKKNYFET